MVYKNLQKKAYPPFHPKIYTPPAWLQQTVNTQPGVTHALVTKNSYTLTQIDNSDIHKLKKNIMKGLFEQMKTMLNLLTTVFNKIK
jgi:hypothetical protein